MRIFFDHNTPAPLRHWLSAHSVETAYERGWHELTNGDLLTAAELDGFEVFVTTDRGIRYQQNLSGRKIAMVIIDTNDWTRIRRYRSLVEPAFVSIAPGAHVEIKIPLR